MLEQRTKIKVTKQHSLQAQVKHIRALEKHKIIEKGRKTCREVEHFE